MPVPVQPRFTGTCFLELPVTANDAPMYLLLKTRTLSVKDMEITYDPETGAMYQIKEQ